MRKIYLSLALLFLAGISSAQLLTFDFAGLAGNEASAGSNGNATGVLSSTITRGSGVSANNNADRFNSTGWTTTASVDFTDYVEFAIAPAGSFSLSVTSIDVQHQRSGTGPVSFVIRTSLDAYAADATNIITIGDVVTTQSSAFTFTAPLMINSSEAVTVRLYGYSAEGGAGSWGPGDGSGNDITVNGTATPGSCSGAPSGQAGFGVITPTHNSASILLTAGTGGTGRVVKMNTTNTFTDMVNGDNPAANTVYGGGEQVIYNNTGTGPVNVTGLQVSTQYFLAIYEFNCLAGRFYLNPGAGGSFTTSAAPLLGLQLAAPNTAYVIDFDNTLAGVNNGQYAGTGFTTAPATGQLNSNAWAVTGWSNGDLAFGGTQTTSNTDYTRGAASAAITTGGMYAFETSTGNQSLGIQPGGNDWAPGTLTLRIQNNTGTPLTQLDLSYMLRVRNDQQRSNSFNFSFSTDDITYTPVAALDYTSPEAPDGLGWVDNPMATSLIGLAVPNGGYVYLRWSGDDVGGSNSRDEFSLDDISVTSIVSQAPTPVFFAHIKAFPLGSGIRIEWSNLSETDVDYYTIERSADGRHFSDLVQVNATRNDGGRADYSGLDASPLNGVNFYRIRSLELDGKSVYSIIARADTRGGATHITLYPNPVNGNSPLSLQANELEKGAYMIRVFNAAGQQLYQRGFNHPGGFITQSLDLPAGMGSGSYYLWLQGHNISLTQPFIIR